MTIHYIVVLESEGRFGHLITRPTVTIRLGSLVRGLKPLTLFILIFIVGLSCKKLPVCLILRKLISVCMGQVSDFLAVCVQPSISISFTSKSIEVSLTMELLGISGCFVLLTFVGRAVFYVVLLRRRLVRQDRERLLGKVKETAHTVVERRPGLTL